MIDQIDQGNTMTQRAMSELSRVLNSERQSGNLNAGFSNIVGLIAATNENIAGLVIEEKGKGNETKA